MPRMPCSSRGEITFSFTIGFASSALDLVFSSDPMTGSTETTFPDPGLRYRVQVFRHTDFYYF